MKVKEELIKRGGPLYCKGLFTSCTNSKTPIPNLNNLDFYLDYQIYIKLTSSLAGTDENYMVGDVETSITVDVHYKNGKPKDAVLVNERQITSEIESKLNKNKELFGDKGKIL